MPYGRTHVLARQVNLDKSSEVLLVDGRQVQVTNPEKVLFPALGLTKNDLVRYYLDLADYALPHLRRRPFLMKRYPNGVEGHFFYQKRVPMPHPEWLETVRIDYPSGNWADFTVVNDKASLAWVANLACIELHTWRSRIDHLERPDELLIDLDPTEGNPWSHVRETALAAKAVLDELGLPSFPKTSGVTGLHILVPIEPELEFPDVRKLAKALAKEIARRAPAIAETTWVVRERTRVFVDYGQNAYDRTIAAAYSVRPTPDARVSAPVRWEEVSECEPAAFTLETMRERIAAVGDLTARMWDRRVSLVGLFRKLRLRPTGREP